jgi:hypothetical protein
MSNHSFPSGNEPCDFHRSSLAHFTTLSAALNEECKSILNPWCMLFDAILSFDEIVSVKVWVGIKFEQGVPADFEPDIN